MGVFRIEKTGNYTVLSNFHFKEKEMSLKAKGLLSLMLSLPDDWDYSIAGLVTLSKDGRDGVMSALDELEVFGYLERKLVKNQKGQFEGYEYIIYERPERYIPSSEKPFSENPNTEKQEQLNTNKSNTKVSNTYSYISTIGGEDEKNKTPERIANTEPNNTCSKVSHLVSSKSIPPSQDEVVEYCRKNDLVIDPYYFYSYYSNNGWVDAVGEKVKNWKKRARTWNTRKLAKTYSAEKKNESSKSTCEKEISEKLEKALSEYPWCKKIDDFHLVEQYGEHYLIPRYTEDGRELDKRGIPIDGKPI